MTPERRMRALLGLGLALGLGVGTAAASPTPMVKAPDGWRADAEQAAAIAKAQGASRPLGDPAAAVAAEIYAPPDGAKVSLVVTRATSRAPGDRGAAAVAALEDVHATVARAQLAGGKATEDSWHKGVSAEDTTLEASLAWHDPDAGTRDLVRIVIAADAATLAAVTGECLAGSDAGSAVVAACTAALTTLDPGIAKSTRVPLPPPGTVSHLSPFPGPDSGSGGASEGAGKGDKSDTVPLAHMADGSRITLPPMAIPQEPQSDRRPVYVGAGIALLGLAFYWNRKQREKFLPEEDKPDDR